MTFPLLLFLIKTPSSPPISTTVSKKPLVQVYTSVLPITPKLMDSLSILFKYLKICCAPVFFTLVTIGINIFLYMSLPTTIVIILAYTWLHMKLCIVGSVVPQLSEQCRKQVSLRTRLHIRNHKKISIIRKNLTTTQSR